MRKLLFLIFLVFFFAFICQRAQAFYNPESRPNNIFGIHILFPTELEQAAKLVNSSGGDWGYVTIPIQYTDRDIEKWQSFMNECARLHLVPIIRLATEPYYQNTNFWRKPEDYDILDFANFLNSLTWPTQNRYVVLYNEVNRFDEWGGEPPDPASYADLVSYASVVFKSSNPDFFLISAGLDNASPNDGIKYMDNFVFLRKMAEQDPKVFNNIDGIASHSYPNPDFSDIPRTSAYEGTSTYKFEENIVSYFAGSEKPVFITETGWNAQRLPGSVISGYLKESLGNIWGQDKNVIAVTPFLLDSQNGAYDKLSFIKNNEFTSYAKDYQTMQKLVGDPLRISLSSMPAVVSSSDYSRSSIFKIESLNAIRFNSSFLKSYIKALLAM